MAATDPILAAALDATLRTAGLPVVGVTVGDPADRSTWIAQLDPSATPGQITQAAAALLLFDLAGLPQRQIDADAITLADQKILRAVVQGLWEAIPAPLLTKVQLRLRILAILKALP